MFRKVLIANRGEIAVRIARACRCMGVRSVAVYSKEDAKSLHVQLADQRICIGEGPARGNYLNIDMVIQAALNMGCDAVHPGYGFLSENSEFARKCEENGLTYFVRAIPYNFYSLLTIVMIITITLMKFDYGPMAVHERNAMNGDLFSGEYMGENMDQEVSSKGKVIDLVIPVLTLIAFCIIGMIYTGGFFDAESGAYMNIATAFAGSDASVGLAWGALIAVIITVIYLVARQVISFKTAMEAIPKGFCAMVPAVIILVFAWTLGGITRGMLGADIFVKTAIGASAEALSSFLPAVIFLIAFGLAFATGTSWGTFGILLPIVITVFAGGGEIMVIAMSACLAGAVCGDHCSPISDTTIMASAGAQCNHVNHVSTQLPYALTVAGVSTVSYILAGFIRNWMIVLPIGIVLMVVTLFVIKSVVTKKAQ